MSEELEVKTIQFKRNPGTTEPDVSDLAIGEPAIAMDGPAGANSKIYIGIADTVDGTTDSVVAIGGGYYTAVVDALVTGGVVNTINGITGDVEILDGVLSFNGATGAIEGVNTVNGLTGNVTLVDLVGVSTFNGATGSVIGVNSVAGLTGAVTLTQSNISDITATAAEINVTDGDAMLMSIVLEGTDMFVVNDGGVMKQTGLGSVTNYIATTTLESLTVDDIVINGNTIGHTVDTDLITVTGGLMTVAGTVSIPGSSLIIDGVTVTSTGTELNSAAGAALTANNLSDLANASTSRTNLGVAIGSNVQAHSAVLDATTASFLTADETKLDAIEASADVTDATNVAAAGALMDSELTSIADVKALDQSVVSGATPTFTTTNFTDDTNKRLMTDAQETKLDTVESSADVTDATNVAAAGAAMISGVDFLDNEVAKPKLKDYAETVNAVGNVNSSTAFDFEDGNVQTVTVAGVDSGSQIVFSLANPPASGIAGTMTVIFTNGLAHGDVAFHSSIEWPGGVAATLSASGVDIISFLTIDAGTTYYGFIGGINFS